MSAEADRLSYAGASPSMSLSAWWRRSFPGTVRRATFCAARAPKLTSSRPFADPLMMLGWKIAPALAVGCSIVFKPAENTPLSSLVSMARLLSHVRD